MKVEVFATIDELKADRVKRKLSDQEIIDQTNFVNSFKRLRSKNLNTESSKSDNKTI
ncbi:hypothetical protein [Fulvivirga ligni]|uniref:hypothetical protein n=1 Tax=Fulvivirga ligni TaxID=2904246 RepID=UPI001F1AAD6E|nr:hypothetical protein [Fulvivirga ligni]UII19117.1 hypothetical protein LVD16_14830 [Fulvivirga ligni]